MTSLKLIIILTSSNCGADLAKILTSLKDRGIYMCVYAYVVTQIMYKCVFTDTYVCSYVYICDCLCENPPYLHANFGLIFMV